MPRILYIQPIHPDGMYRLRSHEGYEVVVAPDTQRDTLLTRNCSRAASTCARS